MTAPSDKDAILQGLADSYAILSTFVESIPEDALHVKRGDGFWSIAEHVAHLSEVQPMGLGRINRMLDEDTPEFEPYFPTEDEAAETPPLPPMGKIMADFKAGREAIIERLSACSDADWQRTAIHPEYKRYGIHIFARHILMHDHWHMYRMEELFLTRDQYISRTDG